MKTLIILAALLAAGAAQAVPPVTSPAQPAAKPQQPTAPAQTASPKRFPGVSDQGNALLAKLQTAPDPQLQALGRQARTAHEQLMSAVMAPVIDMDKVAAALKAQDDALDAVRTHNTERVVAAARQLSDDDRGTFLRTLVLSQAQRTAAPQAQGAAKP
jgi:uncharacterized membrane protein